MAERMRPARERTSRPTTSSNPPPNTPAPSRVQKIQRHRIQGNGTESKPHAIDPDWDGGGHGDQRESESGERDGDQVRMGVEVTERDWDEDR